MTQTAVRRKLSKLVWAGVALWAAAILLYVTVKDPAALLTIRLIGFAGFALLVAGLIRRGRKVPAGN